MALEARADAAPEVLAHHAAEAGKTELAARYLLAAGKAAVARSANAEAISHLRLAIDLVQGMAPTEHLYHLGATWLGTLFALITISGMVILLARRGAIRRVLKVTTVMDVVMYALLAGTIILGTIAVIQFQVLGAGYDYRGTISPWSRSLIIFQPDASLMVGAPLIFQLHALTGTALFLVWPYTRLVHVMSVPVGFLFRPYVVYRSRDEHRGARAIRRGWEPSALKEHEQPKQKQPSI